jgi:hypothetical protein
MEFNTLVMRNNLTKLSPNPLQSKKTKTSVIAVLSTCGQSCEYLKLNFQQIPIFLVWNTLKIEFLRLGDADSRVLGAA